MNYVVLISSCSRLRPPTSTALELLRICKELLGRYKEVEVPFLVAHGGGNVVCDHAYVQELYARAASKDKTLKIYPGMWHQLIVEPEKSMELMFEDMLEWLRTRTQRAAADGDT